MPKTISINIFDTKTIEAAVKKLEAYRDDLPAKCEKIRKKVTAVLTDLVKDGFNGAFYDGLLYESFQVPSVEVISEDGDKFSVVIAKGKEAVFIEFGAGVYYNPGGAPHPNRHGNIVAIGQYGKGYGKRQVWGYYDETGELHLTHGTPASMPMLYAVKEIAERIPDIAREVFGGGAT